MKIYYFGEPYSFSHIAALKRYGKKNDYIAGGTISDTIESVMNKSNAVCIVPIENTTGGIIYDTVDILTSQDYINSDMTIIEELELSIRLYLVAKTKMPLTKIKKIYSHEYALKRAEPWIKTNLPRNIEVVKEISTSAAAKKLINNGKYSCAIASKEVIDNYELCNLGEIKIEGKKNLTRFFILENNAETSKEI